MFKRNQPGLPCVPAEIPLLNDRCIEMKIGGVVNNSCNCCTSVNYPAAIFYTTIFGAGRSHISDFGDVCNGLAVVTIGNSSSGFTPCACIGSMLVVMFRATSLIHCEEGYFYLCLYFASLSFCFGWGPDPPATGSDLEDAKEAIRGLANGDTVRLPAIGGASGPICNTTGAYMDVRLVDCSTISPHNPNPGDDCGDCAVFTDSCSGLLGDAHLEVSGFQDCTVPYENFTQYFLKSNLNGSYILTDRGSTPPTACGGILFDYVWGAVVGNDPLIYGSSESGAIPYEDLGILIDRTAFIDSPDPEHPSPEFQYSIETFAWDVVALGFCATSGVATGSFYLNHFGYVAASYIVIRSGSDVVSWQAIGGSNCFLYYQLGSKTDPALFRLQCVDPETCTFTGDGIVRTTFDYDPCSPLDDNLTGKFTATLSLV